MEKTLKERRLQLLNETVAYYSEDVKRRNLKVLPGRLGSLCMYSPKSTNSTGEGCAIGRLLPSEIKDAIDSRYPTGISIDALAIEHPELIPEDLRGLGTDFLSDLQYLHDSNDYWNDTEGLTTKGKRMLSDIKVTILQGHYKD